MPRGVQDLTGRTVHGAVRRTRCQCLPSGALGCEDHVVQLDLPVGRRGADHEGTADLAAVAAVGRTEADGKEVALLDPTVGGDVTATTGVRAGGDGGGEGRPVGTVVDEAALQLQGEVALGAADENRFEEFAQCLVGDLRADPQTGDLLLVLDDSQLLDRATEVAEPQPGRDRADRAVAGHGEVVFLHRERLGAQGRGQIGRRDRRVAAGSRQHLDPYGLVGPPLSDLTARRGSADQELLAPPEQQDRALGRGAREITHVGRAGHQCGGAAARVAAFSQPSAAGRVHL